MLFCCLLIFFKITFLKKFFQEYHQNGLDPDQARQSIGPYLGPNCLPRLSADGTGRQRVNTTVMSKLRISFVWRSLRDVFSILSYTSCYISGP